MRKKHRCTHNHQMNGYNYSESNSCHFHCCLPFKLWSSDKGKNLSCLSSFSVRSNPLRKEQICTFKGSFLEATLNGKNFLEATLNEKNLFLKEQILTLKDSFPFRITLLFRKENKRLQKMSSIFKTWSYIHLS